MTTGAVSEEKAGLRKAFRARRKALSAAERDAAGLRIQETILGLPEWREADRIALYMALPDEVQTDRLFADCRSNGKDVFVPRFHPDTGYCAWAQHGADDPTRLERWAPEADSSVRWAGDVRPGLVIVPALAIDRSGGRLGQGGGHFDRLLAAGDNIAIAAVFAFQFVDRLPADTHDRPVDMAVTEHGIQDFR
jgi:5-formyltetrahydrofolate cyclo-ligase